MASNRKTFNIKVVCLVETVKIAFGLVSIRDRLPPQKNTQGAASLNLTVLESSDKINPNLTRVLDVNPSLFLAWEVQPPLIYLRGDGRLNNTQSNKSSTTFYLLSFLLNPSSSSSFFVRYSSLQGGEPRGPRGGQADLEHPISAARPDGVPPGRVGFRVFKSARRIVLRIALPAGLLRRELRCITLRLEVHGDVFVCEHTFWRLRWGRSFERSPTRSCYEEIVI